MVNSMRMIKNENLAVLDIGKILTIKKGKDVLFVNKNNQQLCFYTLENEEIAMSNQQYNQLMSQIKKTHNPSLTISQGKKVYSFDFEKEDIKRMEVILSEDDLLEKVTYYYHYDAALPETDNLYKIEILYTNKSVSNIDLSQYNFQNYF